SVPNGLLLKWPQKTWHPRSLMRAYGNLPPQLQAQWIWWNLPEPTESVPLLSDVIETEPIAVNWHTRTETLRLVAMMSAVNRSKLKEVEASGDPTVGTIYRRTRPDSKGGKT